jgi:hypothetical protein
MGKSNYQLSEKQKQTLDDIAKDMIQELRYDCDLEDGLSLFETFDGSFDKNKFTAIVWYIGERLAKY